MSKPVLSICIPTYNRCDALKETINSIVSSDVFINTDKIELVISNNCSSDNTDEVCREFAEKFPDKIKYINQETPVPADRHIFKVLDYASGTFCKLNNDSYMFLEGKLNEIADFLSNNINYPAVFFSNAEPDNKNAKMIKTFDDFINEVSFSCTFIGSFCIKKEVYEKLDEPFRYFDKNLIQVDIYGKLFNENYEILIYPDTILKALTIPQKGGYNIAQVFSENYFFILSEYRNKNNGIKQKTIENQKRKIIKFINRHYFDFENEYNFHKTGYFKYMLKNYMFKPYFWGKYIGIVIKAFSMRFKNAE